MGKGSDQREYDGNPLQTSNGGSGGYKYINVKQTHFNEETGIATVFYYCAFWVDGGDFKGTIMTNYGGWDDQFSVGAANDRYGYHEATLYVAWNSYIHFYEGCGYTPYGAGYRSSTVDINGYPTTPTYKINYNKNTTESVSGLPSSHNKEYGYSVNISSNELTRTNYNFIGGATSAERANNLIIDYMPGAQYTTNANVTLYAVGALAGHYITYDTQGEDPIPSSYFKKIGTTAYITSIIPQKKGYKFKEGNSNSNGTGTTYSAGQGYTDSADLNLYAIGEKINNKNLKIKNENRGTPITAADFNALTYNQLNTKTNNGLVSAGEGHPNQIGATDTNGNPGGYSYASIFLPEFVLESYPQNYDGTYNDTSGYHSNAGGYVGTIYLQKFGKIVCVTFNYLNMGSLLGQVGESSSSGTTQPKIILPEQFRPAYRVHVPELIRANYRTHLNFEPDGSIVLQGESNATSGFGDTIMGTTK